MADQGSGSLLISEQTDELASLLSLYSLEYSNEMNLDDVNMKYVITEPKIMIIYIYIFFSFFNQDSSF